MKYYLERVLCPLLSNPIHSRDHFGPTQYVGDTVVAFGWVVPCRRGDPDDVHNAEFRWANAGFRVQWTEVR
jgi:hypothetical protein